MKKSTLQVFSMHLVHVFKQTLIMNISAELLQLLLSCLEIISCYLLLKHGPVNILKKKRFLSA